MVLEAEGVSRGPGWWKSFFIHRPDRQRLLVVAAVLLVFWDGLFAGFPRADQVQFLYQSAVVGTGADTWLDTLSWNRTISSGDEVLYRPLLYALLVGCHRLFGYNFVLWQLASLILHLIVALGLHALLMRGSLRETSLPVLLTLLFAVSLFGSELVLWHHVMGYVLFCALTVFSLHRLLDYLQSGSLRDFRIAAALGLLAEFTYEMGVLFNLLVACTLVVRGILSRRNAAQLPGASSAQHAYRHGLTFFAIGLAYLLASFLDLALRGMSPAPGRAFSLENLPLSIGYTIKQIAFWFESAMFPTAFGVAPVSRMVVQAIAFGTSPKQLINYGVAVLLATGTLAVLVAWRKAQVRFRFAGALAATVPAILFLLAYSWVIAYGRAVPRGIVQVLYNNVYYSYVAYLAALVGVALFTWSIAQSGRVAPSSAEASAVSPGKGAAAQLPFGWQAMALRAGLCGLLFLHAAETASIAARFRYELALPMDLLDFRARLWMTRHAATPDAYFVLAQCRFRGALYWEQPPGSGVYSKSPPIDPRQRAQSVTAVDLLYPQYSFAMRKAAVAGRTPTIADLCEDGANARPGMR